MIDRNLPIKTYRTTILSFAGYFLPLTRTASRRMDDNPNRSPHKFDSRNSPSLCHPERSNRIRRANLIAQSKDPYTILNPNSLARRFYRNVTILTSLFLLLLAATSTSFAQDWVRTGSG